MNPEFQQFTEVDAWMSIQAQVAEELATVIGRMARDFATEMGWVNAIVLPSEDHKKLNNRYLGHDYATDVLTFPFDEGDAVCGEIYLDATVVAENANRFQVSVEEEYKRMIIHGVLHLFGHDDATDAERAEMRVLEDKYLKLL